MKSGLEQLRMNFEKVRAIGEIYEQLMSGGIADEKELEEARLKCSLLKDNALKLLLHSQKIIQKIETEDIP